ncbi:Sugar-transfer associated ATP-grasp [Streptomyces sp. SolWspMP-5a-2]|nr:sugar-transfer associated ATP-grasp domain-containing protein [Streptomyces sp. SID4950]SCD81364.1 Sugar-transfer associated ATP-grasp [Streptomyces sp. SolWspMP-5a-2]
MSTTGPGSTGRLLRSVFYGLRGVADVWRRRHAVSEDHVLLDALLLALRTGCDSRDIAALRRCGRSGLDALNGVVPRARRAEHRDWNNCAVAAALVNDKTECNRRLGSAGIDVPRQVPVPPTTRIRARDGGPAAQVLEFSHPDIPPGTLCVLKDRQGLQGDSVWAARTCQEPSPGHHEAAKGSEQLRELVRGDRLVAEERLRPPDWFAEAGDTALPTVRVVTSRLSGRTEVVGMVLFRGGPGAVAANRRQGGTAHLMGEDGSFGDGLDAQGADRGPCAYVLPAPWATGMRAMCVRAHRLFPCLGSVGWDVGLAQRGPVLLEGNPNWGMNVPQLMPGRPMLQEFRRTRIREDWRSRPGARERGGP